MRILTKSTLRIEPRSLKNKRELATDMNQHSISDSIKLPESWKAKPFLLIVVGVIALAASLGLSFATQSSGMKVFLHSYLANFIFAISFGIGALFFVLIQFLCRAGWSASIRRMAELISITIPWMALLFVPILVLVVAGDSNLYEWNQKPEDLHGLVKEKVGYFAPWFFVARSCFYIACWIVMASWIYAQSRKQDETGEVGLTTKVQKLSGPMVIVYALSVSFASFDWVMSIDADWYSTIFGVYLFSASMYGFFALMIVLFMSLQKRGKMKENVTVEHFHDMGKFLFGFTMFWSYIAFSQMMLYWYGNIPEETAFFRVRLANGWQVLSYSLIIVHFVLPWLGVVSRHVRRHRAGLTFWAVWGLVAHWLDMAFLVLPNTGAELSFTLVLTHVASGIGMFAIFLGFLFIRASDVPLVAVRDPRLHEAMSYKNPLL